MRLLGLTLILYWRNSILIETHIMNFREEYSLTISKIGVIVL